MTAISSRLVCTFAAFLVFEGASAQNLNLTRPWTFVQGARLTAGDVNKCRTNAPGGAFRAGDPVLQAEADVDERWFGWSICAIDETVSVTFTVGPAPTWVEFECVLNADRDLQDIPGRVSVAGFGSLDASKEIGCAPRPLARAGIGKDAVAETEKVIKCLTPGQHSASGELSVQALIAPGMGNDHAISNAFTTNRNPVGLPQGLILIMQPRGVCPVEDEHHCNIWHLNGDGVLAVGDLAALESHIVGTARLEEECLALADVATPCNGHPDYADFERLNEAWTAAAQGASTVSSACHNAPIRVAPPPPAADKPSRFD